MKTMKWLAGVASVSLLAGAVQAVPGDGKGGSPGGGGEQRMVSKPELPADLQAKLDEVRVARETLLGDLKKVLEANAGATEAERCALVEQWRTDNAAALDAQREAMQAVRQTIREWHVENRPEVADVAGAGLGGDKGQLCEADAEALTTQQKEQRQARQLAAQELKEQLKNTDGAAERKQLVAQHREERLAQMVQARDEMKSRREQTDRDESVATLRASLQESADTLRSESRLKDREQAADRVAEEGDTVRDNLRDQVRDQDRVSR